MNICYIITRSDWGGAQAHLYDLMKFVQAKDGLACCLLIGEEGTLAEKTRELGIRVYVIPHLIQPIRPLKDFLALHEIIQLVKKIKPDLIHLHSSKAGIVGRLAARIAGIPSVFTAHGWAFTEGVSKTRKIISLPIERFMAKHTKKIICVSEYDRVIALENKVGNPEKIVTIHNAIPDINSIEKYKQQFYLTFIMVARFSPQKDYVTLLKAVYKLPCDLLVKFVLIGQGELLRSTQRLTKELNLDEKVSFLGPRPDVPELLIKSEVFLLISNYEGFPISILEAMRAGLPVIASDVGGVKEAVIDGITGFLIPRGDSETLKSKLELLAGNPELRLKMGRAGREHYLQYFTDATMLKKTVAVYESVAENI